MGRVTIDPKDGAGLLLMVGPGSHVEDGDIDVLCFDQGGTKIEWHQNQQNCGLSFVRADGCWGDVEIEGIDDEDEVAKLEEFIVPLIDVFL